MFNFNILLARIVSQDTRIYGSGGEVFSTRAYPCTIGPFTGKRARRHRCQRVTPRHAEPLGHTANYRDVATRAQVRRHANVTVHGCRCDTSTVYFHGLLLQYKTHDKLIFSNTLYVM